MNLGSFSSAGRPQIAADERFPWRALISGVSTILSLPIVCISFYMDFPGCFLIYIATGLVRRSLILHIYIDSGMIMIILIYLLCRWVKCISVNHWH